MPVHEYKCTSCETKYEVFHKVKEDAERIVCPSCQSKEYKKLLSGFSASVPAQSGSSCATGSCGLPSSPCASGMCGLN